MLIDIRSVRYRHSVVRAVLAWLASFWWGSGAGTRFGWPVVRDGRHLWLLPVVAPASAIFFGWAKQPPAPSTIPMRCLSASSPRC